MRRDQAVIVLPLVALTGLVGSACGDWGDPSGGLGAHAGNGSSAEQGGSGSGSGSVAGGGIGGSAGGGVGGSAGAGDMGGAQSSGGVAGTTLSAGAAGQGGHAGAAVVIGPPQIESMTPEAGAYGTLVTIHGSFLGSAARAGVQLRIGTAPAFTVQPDDEALVDSWSEDEIRFQYPFPAEGAISLATPQGSAQAGDFVSSWLTQATSINAPATSVIASISTSAQTVTMLFDSTPPVLLELGPQGAVSHQVALGGAVPSSVRLYLAGNSIEGIGVTDGATPELVHLRNVDGDLVGESAGIVLDATETALAGGPDGACAWLHRSDGWWRARPVAQGWSLDAGPVPDVQAGSPDRAVGAASDGSLYVAWSVDTGNFLDDTEAPRMRRLGSSTLVWGDTEAAGNSVDDYVTSLEILDKGRGIVVRYCGSDSDPWGVSSTSYRCYDGLHTPAGAAIPQVDVDVTASRHAFSAARAVAGYCDGAPTFRLRTDTDTASDPNEAIGEPIVYPCQTTVALEIDPDGDFVPVLRRGTTLYLLGRRAAP